MPHNAVPQAVGLATWSFGMVMTKSSSLTQVSKFIAQVNGEKPNTVRLHIKGMVSARESQKRRKALHLGCGPLFCSIAFMGD